jgi:hypothetical protein
MINFSHYSTFQRWIVLFTALSVLLFSLTGCGISASKEKQIEQLIATNAAGFEDQVKASITSHKQFPEIREGVWKWEYEKGDDGKFIAKYGYYGKNPWWKIIVGGAISIIIGAVTLGFIIWSPWGMDAALFQSLEVDLDKSTVQPKLNK